MLGEPNNRFSLTRERFALGQWCLYWQVVDIHLVRHLLIPKLKLQLKLQNRYSKPLNSCSC